MQTENSKLATAVQWTGVLFLVALAVAINGGANFYGGFILATELGMSHAAGYAVKSSRAVTAVRPYGSTEPLTFLPGTVTHILQLEQIKWENPADFYTMSNFTVKITRNGQTVQYTGCEWTAIEEETRRPLIWLRATLAAKARTEVTGDEATAE